MQDIRSDEALTLLRRMFGAAIAAAQPALCIPNNLPKPPKGRLIVVGAGKASAAMAQAVERNWDGPVAGLVVTHYGYAVPCRNIEIVEAAHPVPDEAGRRAAMRMLELVSGLTADDLVVSLISGGGSSLLALPAAGITLADKQAMIRALLTSGAAISEINCIRRHLSAIKGGRLAAACYPARVVNLIISDVPGDDPVDIASGPSVADPSTCSDAIDILRRYNISVPKHVLDLLLSGILESIKPGDPRLPEIETRLIATPQMALEAAAKLAHSAGYAAHILSDRIEGEARDVGKVLAGIARQVRSHGQPFAPPCVLLSGGETTVTVRGNGRGGRNVEFLLSLGVALDGAAGIYALAGDTDGVDGQDEIAGAVLTPDTLARAWGKGIRPRDSLDRNDGHGFFSALGDSVVTGPTLTNVNDFRAILIIPRSESEAQFLAVIMAQHESTPLLSRPANQVALIELNRPRAANRIQPEDLKALEHLLDECESDETIHVLVFAAKGSYFSAGYDLRALVAGFEAAESRTPRGDIAFEHFVDRLERSRLIVIAAINGPVFGGATDLALACDLRIGTEAVYLQMPAACFGLPLYAGALQRYVSRLGLNHAKRMVFMAQKIDAAELLAMGFLNELSSSAALRARSLEIAEAIAAMPSKPLAAMKQVLNAASLAKGTAKEQREALAAAFDGPEIAKRVRASKSERL